MINIENLKEFLGSDEAFIRTLMEKFMIEIPREGAHLKSAAENKDWQKVRAISHKMLSSTKIFNLDKLTAILQKLEKISENKTNLQLIPPLVNEFEIEAAEVMLEMQQLKDKILL